MIITYRLYAFRLLLAAMLLASAQAFKAPSVRAQFAHTFGKAGFDEGTGIGVDAAGNAYAIGIFNGSIDFDPGPDTATLNSNRTDVFVTSYDPVGQLRFAFKIGNSFATSESAGGIAVEESGRFYIAGGQPFGSIDFDPDPVGVADSSGLIFLAGYEGDSDFRWAARVTGPNESSGEAIDISVDEAGHVYLAGVYTVFLDFAPRDTSRGDIGSAGSLEAFFASFTSDGELRFAQRIGGPDADVARDIVADRAGNVYVTGAFSGTAEFDPDDVDGDADTVTRTSVGLDDIFFASYTSEGHFRFVYTFGAPGLSGDGTGHGLAVDAHDNVYLVGELSGSARFDPLDADQDGDFAPRTGEPNGSAFLVSYTSGGLLRYVNVLKGGMSLATDIATNADGVSYITGTFAGNTDFDVRNDEVSFLNDGGTDVFVTSYDSTGAYRKGFTLTGTGLLTGQGIAFEPNEDVLLTGAFTVMMDLGRDAYVDERTSAGQNDAFIGRYTAIGPSPVANEPLPETPGRPILASPYPNPFGTATAIDLWVPQAQSVRVRVFDILGREIAVLFEGTLAAGQEPLRWDAAGAPAGLYFVRVDGETFTETRQVMKLDR